MKVNIWSQVGMLAGISNKLSTVPSRNGARVQIAASKTPSLYSLWGGFILASFSCSPNRYQCTTSLPVMPGEQLPRRTSRPPQPKRRGSGVGTDMRKRVRIAPLDTRQTPHSCLTMNSVGPLLELLQTQKNPNNIPPLHFKKEE